MSRLGAWEKFSRRRLKAPAGERGSEGLSWAARRAPSPWAPLREPLCAEPLGLGGHHACPPTPTLALEPGSKDCTGTAVAPGSGGLTSSPLKGFHGAADALGAGSVLASPDLGVQGADVEQHAALLEGQGALLGWEPRQRVIPAGLHQAGKSSLKKLGVSGRPRGSCPPQPLPVEEQPEAAGRGDKACLQEAELVVVGREQLQAGLAPAGGPRGLPEGSQLGPTAPAHPRAHMAATRDATAPGDVSGSRGEHGHSLPPWGCWGPHVPLQGTAGHWGGRLGKVPGAGTGTEQPFPKASSLLTWGLGGPKPTCRRSSSSLISAS